MRLQVEHVQATINNLRQSVKDRLHLFGGDAAIHLRKAIYREAKNFHHIPVGPLGELLSLTDDRYITACLSLAWEDNLPRLSWLPCMTLSKLLMLLQRLQANV